MHMVEAHSRGTSMTQAAPPMGGKQQQLSPGVEGTGGIPSSPSTSTSTAVSVVDLAVSGLRTSLYVGARRSRRFEGME